jgi:hypothetical protein
MSEHVKLEASDGHELDAYVAHPEGGPIAGLVVVQEIFGVNRHIRSVADGYAKDGCASAVRPLRAWFGTRLRRRGYAEGDVADFQAESGPCVEGHSRRARVRAQGRRGRNPG